MVFEILVKPQKLQGKPWAMYFLGIFYSLLAIVLSFWVFKSYVSLIMVVFTAIASVPLIHASLESEERREARKRKPGFREHMPLISAFTYLFLGFVTVFSVLYVVLPSATVQTMFSSQIDTIVAIHSTPTGSFISTIDSLGKILLNNTKILFFCLIFSFFYGVGAIFILSWNASVMGTAIGSAIRHGLEGNIGNYFSVISLNLLGYFIHGIPEMVAYFIAAIAGGVISFALMKEKFMSARFKKIAFNSMNLFTFSIVILILAGLIEVFVSPHFFL